MRAAAGWAEKIMHTKDAEVKRNSMRVLAKVFKEIQTNFADDDSNILEKELRTNISNTFRSASSNSIEVNSMNKKYLDFPREHRRSKEQQ